jgi:hypothetical protein
MSSLDKIKNNELEVIHKDLPLKIYFDEESQSIVLESDYDIVFKSKGNIVTQASEKQVLLGKEIHINPSSNVLIK